MRLTRFGVVIAFIVTGIVVPDSAAASDTPSVDPLAVLEASSALITAAGPPDTPGSPSFDVVLSPDVHLDIEPPPALIKPVEQSEPAPPRVEPAPPAGSAMAVTGSIRDRALDKLRALGAAQWQISIFDCIGAHESGWQSKRSNRMNSNGTWDHGPFQINDIHWPALNAQHLDPYVPEDAAVYVWQLSRSGTSFGAWSVHGLCGV